MASQPTAHEETLNQMRHQLKLLFCCGTTFGKNFCFRKSFFASYMIETHKIFLQKPKRKFFVLYFNLNDTIMT